MAGGKYHGTQSTRESVVPTVIAVGVARTATVGLVWCGGSVLDVA